MTSVEQYRQNLEVLQANAPLINDFVTAADVALFSAPDFGFFGYPDGRWEQRAGSPAPQTYVESARATAQDLLVEVQEQQVLNALAADRPPIGLMESYKFTQFVVRAATDATGAACQLRWFGVTGIRGATEYTTADSYRFDRLQGGAEAARTTLLIAHLGSVPVSAGYWFRPDEDAFAEKCFDVFANKSAVDRLLSGNFDDEDERRLLLNSLLVDPEQATLYEQLDRKSLEAKRGNQLASEFDLIMPNRDQLADSTERIRDAF